MRIYILFISFLFLNDLSYAQISKPEKGSIWVYNYQNIAHCGPIIGKYIGDTLLHNKNAMVISQTFYNKCVDPGQPKIDTIKWGMNFIAIEDSVVWLWKKNTYEVLYDFGDTVGSVRIIRQYENDTLTTEILKKGMDEILGCYLVVKYEHHSNMSQHYELQDTICELLLGGSAYMIPEMQIAHFLDGQSGGPLACFSNSKGRYSEKTWTPQAESCLSEIVKLNVDELNDSRGFLIYPNPASGFIELDVIWNSQIYLVNDVLGQHVLSGTLPQNKRIDTDELITGLYYLHVTEDLSNRVSKFYIECKAN